MVGKYKLDHIINEAMIFIHLTNQTVCYTKVQENHNLMISAKGLGSSVMLVGYEVFGLLGCGLAAGTPSRPSRRLLLSPTFGLVLFCLKA